jgi:hypothetical protein
VYVTLRQAYNAGAFPANTTSTAFSRFSLHAAVPFISTISGEKSCRGFPRLAQLPILSLACATLLSVRRIRRDFFFRAQEDS